MLYLRNKMKYSVFASVCLSSVLMANASVGILSLKSPDGRNEVNFSKNWKELTYSVKVDGKDVILPSRAGLQLDNRVWEMALGKRDLVQPDC